MRNRFLVLVALAGAVSGCNETRQHRMDRMQPVSYSFGGDGAMLESNAAFSSEQVIKRYRPKASSKVGKRRRTAYRVRAAPKSGGWHGASLKQVVVLKRNAGISCLPRNLKNMIRKVSRHFGKKVIITSGHRSLKRNVAVGGVRRSFHLTCKAVDMKIAGVSKHRLARYVKSLPGRGGVGTYCGKNIVHLDVGPRRAWNYHCRGWRGRYAKR